TPADRGARQLFDRLLEVWRLLERESDRYELMFGQGVLAWTSGKGTVYHPLAVWSLSIDFNPEVPEFVLRESDRGAELYSAVLHWSGVDGARIGSCRRFLDALTHEAGAQALLEGLAKILGIQYVGPGGLAAPPQGRPWLGSEAVIYLGQRHLGLTQAIEGFLELLPSLPELPAALVRIVGIDDRPPAETLERPFELLYTLPANPEQERVGERLHKMGCVLVQGPPGTGKTHTIANLIGHLLAEGKTILVTSHTTKALRVLRGMVSPALRPLCVSVLDNDQESREQLEISVKGIVDRFTHSDPEEMTRLADSYEKRRVELKERLQQAEQRLLDACRQEYSSAVSGEGLHPVQAARAVAEGRGVHDWIPGTIQSGAPLPLSPDEIFELYGFHEQFTTLDERELAGNLPPLDRIVSENRLHHMLELESRLEPNPSELTPIWSNDQQTPEDLQALSKVTRAAVESLAGADPWFLECAWSVKMGEESRRSWEDLADYIETVVAETASLERRVFQTGPTLNADMPDAEAQKICAALIALVESGRSVGWQHTMLKPNWKKFLDSARVDGVRPNTLEHFQALDALLQLRIKREGLRRRWDRQMAGRGVPTADQLGEHPEGVCAQYARQIRLGLNWLVDFFGPVEKAMKVSHVNWERVLDLVPPSPEQGGEMVRVRAGLSQVLEPAIIRRMDQLEWRPLNARFQMMMDYLSESPSTQNPTTLGYRLKKAATERDGTAFSAAWNRVVELSRHQERYERRRELLSRLTEAAPDWGNAVATRQPPHDQGRPPGDPVKAWKHKNWELALAAIGSEDLDELHKECARLRDALQESSVRFVENQAWAAQLRRTGVRQQQALVGWLDLMRKVGAGTGKRAAELRATARESLTECRESVPVWIMPLSKVAESFQPGKSQFDVVILDEASQCDLRGLTALALGRQVLVVGDHQQVSPEGVGQAQHFAKALSDEFLSDIPNRELYDGTTSVYDLARQSFGGSLRLLEHFRSVPEIIAFSNALCYEYEVLPLREGYGVKVTPPTVAYHVANATSDRKVNEQEAMEVASLVVAATMQPEYAHCTMGVVSLVGDEQAKLIDRLLVQHLPLTEYRRRRIVCGNAAQFQGDERDVIFLSMVDAPEGEGQLAIRRSDVFIKRFNVAASRARDQMWVVHSIDPDQHLKTGDLRDMLIRFAREPATMAPPQAEPEERAPTAPKGDFEFHHKVAEWLQKAGYRVAVHKPVGAYQLDLIVEGRGGRVAVKCYGESEYPPEKLVADIYREVVLSRMGWRFIRLRGSRYFLDPKAEMASLFAKLEELGLQAFEPGETPGDERTESGRDLMGRVGALAAKLRAQWGQVDTSGMELTSMKGGPQGEEVVDADPTGRPTGFESTPASVKPPSFDARPPAFEPTAQPPAFETRPPSFEPAAAEPAAVKPPSFAAKPPTEEPDKVAVKPPSSLLRPPVSPPSVTVKPPSSVAPPLKPPDVKPPTSPTMAPKPPSP
ncbi:MAG: AAA domain-containing protein, partial [Candidatus Eremiobacterota bacterium]